MGSSTRSRSFPYQLRRSDGPEGAVRAVGPYPTVTISNWYGGTFTLDNNGTIDVGAAVILNVDNTFTHATGAAVQGVGTIDLAGATSSLCGYFNPGKVGSLDATNTLSLTAPAGGSSFVGTPGMKVDIDGLTADTQHDQLAVTGNLTLTGTLMVTLPGIFVPSINDAFTIITATSISGTFTTLNLPALPFGSIWSVDYSDTTKVVLRVTGG